MCTIVSAVGMEIYIYSIYIIFILGQYSSKYTMRKYVFGGLLGCFILTSNYLFIFQLFLIIFIEKTHLKIKASLELIQLIKN